MNKREAKVGLVVVDSAHVMGMKIIITHYYGDFTSGNIHKGIVVSEHNSAWICFFYFKLVVIIILSSMLSQASYR